MDILQLKYFEKVAQLESVTKAATELGVSQSQVSKSISKLEADVGTKLFDRIGRQIKLNEQGVIFLNSTKKILSELNNCSRQIRYHKESYDGRLTICVVGPILHPVVTQAISDYSEMYKSVSFQITTLKDEPLAEMDLEGVDFLITKPDSLPKGFKGIQLPTDETYVLMSYRNHLAKRPYLDIEDLVNEELVVSQYVNSEEADSVYSMFMMNNVSPNIKIAIEDHSPKEDNIFKHLLITSSENYIGLIPGSYRCLYEKNSDFVTIPLRTYLKKNDWATCFAWDKNKILNPVANAFQNYIQINAEKKRL